MLRQIIAIANLSKYRFRKRPISYKIVDRLQETIELKLLRA